jgi:hypothetical protein
MLPVAEHIALLLAVRDANLGWERYTYGILLLAFYELGA